MNTTSIHEEARPRDPAADLRALHHELAAALGCNGQLRSVEQMLTHAIATADSEFELVLDALDSISSGLDATNPTIANKAHHAAVALDGIRRRLQAAQHLAEGWFGPVAAEGEVSQ